MKSVLYIGGFELPDKNAAAQRVIANAQLLREMGFDVSFIGVSKDLKCAPEIVNGFTSNPVPYPTNIKQWALQILTFIKSQEIINRRPEYVVLYNFPSIASLKILNACHKHGIKVIHDLTEWESVEGFSPRELIKKIDICLRMHYCIKKMDGVIAISQFLYNYYKKYTNCIIIPPTVDLANPKWQRDRILAHDSVIKLIYAGNAGLGQKDKLDLIINSLRQFPTLQFDIIGMTLKEYQKSFGKVPSDITNINFHGRVSHKKAVEAICKADFQVLIRENNLKNNAGFPSKFVESISCCTPVIATLTSNINDYLQNGRIGFIVSKEQPLEDVFKLILTLSKDQICAMKQACRSLTCFDYRNYKEEFSKIFK